MAGLGVQVRDGVAEIYPWKADKELAAALDTKEGALLLRLDQTDFDLNGEAIINSTEFFLADAFKFQVYRKGTGSRGHALRRALSRRRGGHRTMSEFIFMLTRGDVTVSDALAQYAGVRARAYDGSGSRMSACRSTSSAPSPTRSTPTAGRSRWRS